MDPTKPQKESVVSVLHLTTNTKNVINLFDELMICLLTSFNKGRLSQHFKKWRSSSPPALAGSLPVILVWNVILIANSSAMVPRSGKFPGQLIC